MSRKNRNAYRDSLDIYKAKKGIRHYRVANMEEVLRDFQKDPIVLCERYDITPYLTKQPYLRKPTFVAIDQVANFSKLCSVKLARENLQLLQDITRNRLNNTNLTCNICQKEYTSERKLLNHQENKHMLCYKPENKIRKKVSFSDEIIVHELKEYHSCRKCPKIYEDYESLKSHMKDFHKKRKCYVCFYCSKDFVDRMFFKLHIKLHCDSCGALFPNKKEYNDHRRFICKKIKKYVCKTCQIIVFHFLDLKDHSYEHLGTFYICDICKDRFDDKCALSHHIKFLHSKRRPKSLYTTQTTEDEIIYRCNFCELSTQKLVLMVKHVSTFPEYDKCAMTGYRDFYFCDQCFEKFSTETDMLQHKWSHFLVNNPQKSPDSPKPITVFNMEASNLMRNTTFTETTEVAQIQNSKITENTTEVAQVAPKRFYNLNEELPEFLRRQPRVVVERLPFHGKNAEVSGNLNDVTNLLTNDLETLNNETKKKRHTKTLISKYQCKLCLKYLSTNSTLKRHMLTLHGQTSEDNFSSLHYYPQYQNPDNLRCHVCEEDFALPSLLQTHNCFRANTFMSQIQLTDAKSTNRYDHNMGLDDIICIDDDDDYMNNVDFDIPAPIVELTEYENVNLVINNDRQLNGAANKDAAVDGNSHLLDDLLKDVPVGGNKLNTVAVDNNNTQLINRLSNPAVRNDMQHLNGQLNSAVVLSNRLLNNIAVNGNDSQRINGPSYDNNKQIVGAVNRYDRQLNTFSPRQIGAVNRYDRQLNANNINSNTAVDRFDKQGSNGQLNAGNAINRQLPAINRKSLLISNNPQFVAMPINRVSADSNGPRQYFNRLLNTAAVDGKQKKISNLRLVVTEVPIEF
ncbi:zinc finger protein 208 [Bicyclus anynana]|uniref:Zinc finger protein 208 n=1 Tax=Bicyclus anynana TaxID=110368 RepID=A0A6J1P4Y2_BICAN|nr:zinc finger protein 208 [Bicyclus anynana]